MKAIEITTKIAVTTAALVILSAGILGYTALYDLFVSIGLFSAWLGIFFPLLFDLAEVTAAVSVFNAKLSGEDDKFSWGMVILFTILGIVANIGHAAAAWYIGRIDNLQAILAIFATSLFPLSVALATHLVKRVIARDIARRGFVSTLSELAGQVDRAGVELADLLNQKQAAAAKLESLQNDIRACQNEQKHRSGTELTAAKLAKVARRRDRVLALLSEGLSPADIAGELDVTVRTIKRDIVALNGRAGVTR